MEFEENKANKTDLETTASSRERVGIGGLTKTNFCRNIEIQTFMFLKR